MNDVQKTIDLTPVGMNTPEGAARVAKTLEAWQSAQANVANRASSFLFENLDSIERGLREDSELDAVDDLREIIAAVHDMAQAQDAFMRALAGRA